jgi:hypothetical protein
MTTEKDAARLAEKMGSTPDSISWLVLPLLAAIEPADAFRAWLFERVNRE